MLHPNKFFLFYSLLIGFLLINYSTFAQTEEQATVSVSHQEVQRFGTVIAQIKKLYVKAIEDKHLFSSAIQGMLAGLDPHSSYLDQKALQELQTYTDGNFVGLGIEITQEKGLIKVISPIDDTPAHKAGIKPGDYIIAVDDKPFFDIPIEEAIQRLRGKKGSSIKLTVLNEKDKKQRHITIKRGTIQIKSVKSKMLHDGFGYIRVSHFQKQTGDQIIQSIKKLHKKAGGQLKGLIVDLRNNPGGVLETSGEVADIFLDAKTKKKDKIYYVEGRMKDIETVAYATPGDLLYDAPLIILINEGSASASEIVAGALQDHKRAVIMGKRSFGKGSVQSIFPIDDTTAIKLTTALYYTPSGRSIQAKGIQPDIIVDDLKLIKEQEEALFFWKIRERDLQRHLKNSNSKKKDEAKLNGINLKILATTDYQLYEALKLLKSMHVFQKRMDT